MPTSPNDLLIGVPGIGERGAIALLKLTTFLNYVPQSNLTARILLFKCR
jgi:hypothetical protein